MSKSEVTKPASADVTVTPAAAAPASKPVATEPAPSIAPASDASAAAAPAKPEPPSLPTAATVTKSGTPKVESVKIEPAKSEPPKAEPKAEPKTEPPKADARKPADADKAPVKPFIAAKKPEAAPNADASPRSRRFALLAASIALVAALGAFAGALGAAGLARPSAAAVDTTAGTRAADADMQRVLKSLASDVAALKASLDAGGKATNAQFAKLTERLDRIERRASAASTTTTDTTGSTAPTRAAAVPEPRLPPTSPAAEKQTLDGWVLRDIYDGRALVESRFGGLYEIGPGANLPGVGRVETIKRQDGRWVVVTSRGIITSVR